MSAKHFHAHWLPETEVAPPTTSPGAAFLTFMCLPWLLGICGSPAPREPENPHCDNLDGGVTLMSQPGLSKECREAREALARLELYAARLPTVYRSAMKLMVAVNRALVNQKCGKEPTPTL